MDVLLVFGILALTVIALGAAVMVRRAFVPRRPRLVRRQGSPPTGRLVTLALDVEHVDPADPPIERMVRDVADRVLATSPGVEEVVVKSRDGALLGRVPRNPIRGGWLNLPAHLHEPHRRRPPGPDLTGHLAEDEPFRPPRPEGPIEVSRLAPAIGGRPEPGPPLAERFELPDSVKALLADPADGVDLVRAILEAGGHRPRVSGDVILVGGQAVVVLQPSVAGAISHEALSHAYLRIQDSGAVLGLVIGLGYMDTRDVRRREMLAPHVSHVGSKAIQRMADAVALGADPLWFARGPAVVTTQLGRAG